jgi:hypothetical protein
MSSFSMHYRGDRHAIDAKALSIPLLSVTHLIGSINKDLGGDEELKVEVNAPERGSFEVEITLTGSEIANAFSNGFGLTDAVLGTLLGVFELYRFLSSHDVEQVEERDNGVEYVAEDGAQFIADGDVYLVYGNKGDEVDRHLRNAFKAMNEDEGIDGFDLEPDDEDKRAFRADRGEFPALAEGPADEEEETKVTEAIVSVYQPSLDGTRQWGVNYDGHKIQASVEDKGFLKRVRTRSIKLGNGDRLNVDLEITREWDQASQDWINKSYSILSVYDVIPAGNQSDAFAD